MADNNQRSKDAQDGENTSENLFSKDELLSMVTQAVSQQVNSAITQRNSAFEKRIEALLFKALPQTASEETPDGQASVKPGRVSNSRVEALEKQLADMKAKEEAGIAKERDMNLRKNVSDQLAKAGIAPQWIKAALATLNEDKRVAYTADEFAPNKDSIVWKSEHGEEDLTTGLRNWIRSDEGKSFLAPKGAQGSGDRNYSPARPTSGELSDNDLASLLTNLRNG